MQPSRLQFLHALIRKEARSLLQYIAESFPWATAARQPALHAILEIAKHESHQVDQLIRHSIKTKLGVPSCRYNSRPSSRRFCAPNSRS